MKKLKKKNKEVALEPVKEKKQKKKSKKEGKELAVLDKTSRSKAEKAILASLGKEFSTVNSPDEDDVPYNILFKHVGMNFITGGIPGGVFMEIHGPSQCGKSYIMYELGGAFIDANGWYMQADIERAYKPNIGRKLGLEGSARFVKTKERNMEKLFPLMQKFVLNIRKVDKDCPILLGVDSFNPLQTNDNMKALEKELKKLGSSKAVTPMDVKGYAMMRKNAKFSELIKDFIIFLEEQKATLVLLNQQRKKYGIMFGDDKTTNADEIIQFYCTTRLRGHLGKKLKEDSGDKETDKGRGRTIGREVTWECLKSRHPDVAPFMKVTTQIIYKEGIKPYSGLADLLIMEKIGKKCKIGKSNGIEINGEKMKLTKVGKYVEAHPEILKTAS